MFFFDNIVVQLNPLATVIVLFFCLFLILRRLPEIATGIYLVIPIWIYTYKISNIAQTWILLATMFGAALLSFNKNKVIYLPKNDLWIIPWVLFWWLWSILLLYYSGTTENFNLIKTFLAGTIFPLPIIMLFSRKTISIELFSISYILTTMIGGFILLGHIGYNYQILIINPLSGNYGVGRLPIYNYHSFAYPYGISIIMLVALFHLSKNHIVRITCGCSVVYCFYFLYFSGSRQTILATFIVCIIFLAWLIIRFKEDNTSYSFVKTRISLFIALIVFLLYYFFESSPITIFKGTHATKLSGIQNIIESESRWETWSFAIQKILDSYFMGTAYEAGNTHNFFLSVLANEGIVGFILMMGFFIFFFKQVRNIWFVKLIDGVSIWRMAFFCIFLSTIIHSQFSGDNVSAPELFWSVVYLWYLKDYSNIKKADFG